MPFKDERLANTKKPYNWQGVPAIWFVWEVKLGAAKLADIMSFYIDYKY